MLLTEDEAKERWCRFGRYEYGSVGANRWHVQARRDPDTNEQFKGFTQKNPEQCRCIASQCMAWRWQPLQADQPFMDAVKKRMDDAKDKHPTAVKYVRANLAEFGLPDKPFRGYCGDAGKPEA